MNNGSGARILLLNPNSSAPCSAGIDAAVAGFRRAEGPAIEVVTVAGGPPGIYTWRDWHAAVGPLCQAVARERADVFVVACASDPGIAAVREVTPRPVLGVFACAVAAALVRARVCRLALAAAMNGAQGEPVNDLQSIEAGRARARHSLADLGEGLESFLATERERGSGGGLAPWGATPPPRMPSGWNGWTGPCAPWRSTTPRSRHSWPRPAPRSASF